MELLPDKYGEISEYQEDRLEGAIIIFLFGFTVGLILAMALIFH